MLSSTLPHIRYSCGLVIAVLIAISNPFMAYADTNEYDRSETPLYVPGEVIVKFKSGVFKEDGLSSLEEITEILSKGIEFEYGVYETERILSDELLFPDKPVNHPRGVWTWEDWQENVAEFELDTFYLVKYSGEFDPPDVAEAYNGLETVDFAEPNGVGYEEDYLPNDPDLQYQWYLHNTGQYDGTPGADIHASEAWWYWSCLSSLGQVNRPILAILDSGVRMEPEEHEDLIASRSGGYDIFDDDPVPEHNGSYHGTMVAGVAAAATNNNLTGIASPTWNQIYFMPIKTWETGSGDIYISNIVPAIIYAVANGADAINMSFGLRYGYSLAVEIACRFAYANGVVNVASKGNANSDEDHYPSDYKEVIAVAGTDNDDNRWFSAPGFGSNYGDDTEIAAPSMQIYTTYGDGGYEDHIEGTSFSTPLVAAACTLIADAIGPTSPPDDRVVQTRTILHACVDDVNSNQFPGWDIFLGHGRLNLYYVALYIDNLNKGKASSETAADIQKLNKTPLLSVPSPNPVKDTATFNFIVPGGYTGPGSLEVFDIKGRKIDTVYFAANGVEGTVELDARASALSPGVYIGRVKTDEYSSPVKFIVE